MAPTVKMSALTGRYALDNDGGLHYVMARNLVRQARAGYDAALDECDALVLPTVPYVAPELPSSDVSVIDLVTASRGMLGNTAPFDATGHPATSVLVGFVRGMPVGMAIVARRFAHASCLRIAGERERTHGVSARTTPAEPRH